MSRITQRGLPSFGKKYSEPDAAINEMTRRQFTLLKGVYSNQSVCHLIPVNQTSGHVSTLSKGTQPTHWTVCNESLKTCSVGLWIPLLNGCAMIRSKGTVLHHASNTFYIQLIYGIESPMQNIIIQMMYPEETLFLMERGALIVFNGDNGNLMCIQEMYETILATIPHIDTEAHNNKLLKSTEVTYPVTQTIPLAAYICYAYIRRLGANVVRLKRATAKQMIDMNVFQYSYFNLFNDIQTYLNSKKKPNPTLSHLIKHNINDSIISTIPTPETPGIIHPLINHHLHLKKRLFSTQCKPIINLMDTLTVSEYQYATMDTPFNLWSIQHKKVKVVSDSTVLDELDTFINNQEKQKNGILTSHCIIHIDDIIDITSLLACMKTNESITHKKNNRYQTNQDYEMTQHNIHDDSTLFGQDILISLYSESQLPEHMIGTSILQTYHASCHLTDTDCIRH